MTVPASPSELPQLPEPYYTADPEPWQPLSDLFNEQQMRQFGQQCYEAGVRAERAKFAKLICDTMRPRPGIDPWKALEELAAATSKGE